MRTHRRLYLPAALLIILPQANFSHAAHEFHLSNDFSETYNNVTGPGKSQSSLTEGFRFLNVLNVNGSGNITTDWTYAYSLGFKATDDKKNDQQNISLTNLNARFSNKIHTINLGDSFESLSQYTLNTGLKGASYRYAAGGTEITLISGLAYPRWDNIFSIGYGQIKSQERLAWGARGKQEIFDGLSVALNVAGARDTTRMSPTDMMYDQNIIYSMDWEYKPMTGLTFRGESAYSTEKKSPSEGAQVVESHGNAHKVEAIGDGGPSRVTLEYERVSPDFFTLIGSATADREKAKTKWRYSATKNIATTLGFLWFHDNLDNQKTQGTTNYYKPEAAINFKNVFGRKYAVTDFSYKLDYSELNNATAKADNIVNANYRDRFWFLDTDANFGFIAYNTKLPANSRSKEFTYNLTVSSRHSFENIIIAPSVYAGTWRSQNELSDAHDEIYDLSAGLGLDFPNANVNTSIRGGKNRLLKSTGDNSDKFFANASINWRPESLAKATKLNQAMIYARFMLNDYQFTTIPSRDYRENSATAGFSFQF